MNLRLRRALGMLRLGRTEEAVEVATEAMREGGQPPLAAVTVAARLAAAVAKSLCGGMTEEDALDELTMLKVRSHVIGSSVSTGMSCVVLGLYSRARGWTAMTGNDILWLR